MIETNENMPKPVDFNELFVKKGSEAAGENLSKVESKKALEDFLKNHLPELESLERSIGEMDAQLAKENSRIPGAITTADIRKREAIDRWQYQRDQDQLMLGRLTKEKAAILEAVVLGLDRKDSAKLYDKILTDSKLSDDTIEGLLVAWTKLRFKKALDRRGNMNQENQPEGSEKVDKSISPEIIKTVDEIGETGSVSDIETDKSELNKQAEEGITPGIELKPEGISGSESKGQEEVKEEIKSAEEEIETDNTKPEGIVEISPSGEIEEKQQESIGEFNSEEKQPDVLAAPLEEKAPENIADTAISSPETPEEKPSINPENQIGEVSQAESAPQIENERNGAARIEEVKKIITGASEEPTSESTQNGMTESAPSAEAVAAVPEQKKPSFWGRLFGRKEPKMNSGEAQQLHQKVQEERAPHIEEGGK